MNSGLPSRDSSTGVYQVPLAVDLATSKRTGPRDFILSVANAVDSNGGRKHHLDVALETFVTKVNFDHTNGSTPRATGVDFKVKASTQQTPATLDRLVRQAQ